MKDKINIEIGKNIAIFRKAKGWTQEELAGASGFSLSKVADLERGFRGLKMEDLAVVCQLLSCTADGLLGEYVGKPSEGLDSDTLRLVTAFKRVKNTEKRYCFVKLMEAINEKS